MSVTASDVKNLREATGAGMMACKEALGASGGNFEEAVDYLRKKGLAAAQKKQSRIAAEGAVTVAAEGQHGVVVEVNCETDFVSKGEDFQSLAQKVANHLLKNKPATVEELLEQKFLEGPQGGTQTVAEAINELTLKCGEKVAIRRFEYKTLANSGLIGNYSHSGRIGVLVELEAPNALTNNPKVLELAKDLAMHVAAANPTFLSASDIDENFKNREAEIYKSQLKAEGKPENMIDKIVLGKLGKLASEVCLLEQKFIKDSDLSISKLLATVSKEVGGELKVVGYTKINLGEGIEKKVDDLAEEVAKMTGQK